jgi:hypothetical protein
MSNLILPPGYRYARSAGVGNRPVRNEEREKTVREWVKNIDSSLDVRWFEDLANYAVTVDWPLNDPRRELIQKGEIGDAPYDILLWASVDPHNGDTMALPIDEMESKILEVLATADNSRQPWKDRLKSIAEANVTRRRKLREDFIEHQVHDIAVEHRNEALGIHQVSVPTEIK